MYIVRIKRQGHEITIIEVATGTSKAVMDLACLLEFSTDASVLSFTVSDCDGIVKPDRFGAGTIWHKWEFE